MNHTRLTLRATFGALTLLLGALSATVQARDALERVERFDAAGLREVESRTAGGSIEVIGGGGDEAQVTMRVKPQQRWMDEDDIQAALADYDIVIERDGDRLLATARYTRGGNHPLSVSFALQVPEDVSASMETAGGSLTLERVDGTHRMSTAGGSLNLRGVRGETEAKTAGGSIQVADYDGNLQARTSGGSVDVRDSQGTFELSTSGGSIKLDAISGEVEARTSGGSIRAELAALSGGLALHTSGGSVHAQVPDGLGLDVRLRGDRAEIQGGDFQGSSKRGSVDGTVNGGGIPVELTTSGGSVSLSLGRAI